MYLTELFQRQRVNKWVSSSPYPYDLILGNFSASRRQPSEAVMKITGNRGVDTAIEAVGVPATF